MGNTSSSPPPPPSPPPSPSTKILTGIKWQFSSAGTISSTISATIPRLRMYRNGSMNAKYKFKFGTTQQDLQIVVKSSSYSAPDLFLVFNKYSGAISCMRSDDNGFTWYKTYTTNVLNATTLLLKGNLWQTEKAPQSPSPVPTPVPAPSPTLPPPPPPQSSFTNQSHILSSTPAQRADENACAVYYTKLTDACDQGVFELSDTELRRQYGNNPQIYQMIMNEKKNLPEPGVCKIKLQNWKRPNNSPLLNTMEPGLANRGNPSDWAFCFQSLQDQSSLQPMIESTQNSTAFQLHTSPLTGVFGDNLSYARLAFKKLDYTSVKQDACTYVNKDYIDSTIPTGLIGITLDSSMKIKKIGVYKIENGKMVEDITLQIDTYKRLFEEKLTNTVLMYNPKSASATIFVLGKDVCGNFTNKLSASAIFNIGDFGIQAKQLYQSSSTTDVAYGTTDQLKAKLIELNQKRADETAKYNTLTDNFLKIQFQLLINDYDKRIQKIMDILKIIEDRMKNTINEQLPNAINKKLHSGIPPILISSDSILYIQVL